MAAPPTHVQVVTHTTLPQLLTPNPFALWPGDAECSLLASPCTRRRESLLSTDCDDLREEGTDEDGETASALAESTAGDGACSGVVVGVALAAVGFGAMYDPPSALVAGIGLLLGPFIPMPGLR